MPNVCSCGAQLVEDARFCHRCGNQPSSPPSKKIEIVEQPVVSEQTASVVDNLSPALEALTEITFSNGHAVRIGVIVAACAVLVFVPLAGVMGLNFAGILLVTLLSGLLAVVLYQRRTGAVLSPKQGARLGWITGIFIFLIFLVLFTVSLIPALESGDLARIPDEALQGKLPQADIDRVKDIMGNPTLLTASILFFMAVYFVGATVLTSLGGMLGAKFLGRPPKMP